MQIHKTHAQNAETIPLCILSTFAYFEHVCAFRPPLCILSMFVYFEHVCAFQPQRLCILSTTFVYFEHVCAFRPQSLCILSTTFVYFEHIICVLKVMFAHFDHNVCVFCVQNSSILNMALFFVFQTQLVFLYFSDAILSTLKFHIIRGCILV